MKDGYIDEMRATYKRRRDLFVDGLNSLGWKVKKPKGTMYVWIPVPHGYDSSQFSLHVLKKTGVVISPGIAFGNLGEGYVRIALVANENRLSEALERMKKAGINYNVS
jgi:LL-diaminopimelate aminotransferase